MTTIQDLRKLHEQNKSWNPYATESTWPKKHIDALFAEIDRLTSENEALRKTLDSDLPGDAGYGHCNWCEKSTVKLFDGKVWVCKECSIIQPAKPRTLPTAPSAAPAATKRPIPVLSPDEAELLDDMLAYDPHYERTEKREPKKHQMLVELEKQGLVFWYKNPGEDKAWTLSSWGRSVAAHYNVADDGSDDPAPTPAPAPAVKLTKAQRQLLGKAADGLPYAYVLMERDGVVLRTMKTLEKRNLITVHKSFHHGVGLWQFDCTITPAGRKALEAK